MNRNDVLRELRREYERWVASSEYYQLLGRYQHSAACLARAGVYQHALAELGVGLREG